MLAVEGLGCGLAWSGLALAVCGGRARPPVWELQAVGIAVLGGAWISVLSSVGLLAG